MSRSFKNGLFTFINYKYFLSSLASLHGFIRIFRKSQEFEFLGKRIIPAIVLCFEILASTL
jgi:hypothetical protein